VDVAAVTIGTIKKDFGKPKAIAAFYSFISSL
jgi:hypothetical protein